MPEIGNDYLSALVDDARKIAAGLQSVSEVAITIVGRGAPPRVFELSKAEQRAINIAGGIVNSFCADAAGDVRINRDALLMIVRAIVRAQEGR